MLSKVHFLALTLCILQRRRDVNGFVLEIYRDKTGKIMAVAYPELDPVTGKLIRTVQDMGDAVFIAPDKNERLYSALNRFKVANPHIHRSNAAISIPTDVQKGISRSNTAVLVVPDSRGGHLQIVDDGYVGGYLSVNRVTPVVQQIMKSDSSADLLDQGSIAQQLDNDCVGEEDSSKTHTTPLIIRTAQTGSAYVELEALLPNAAHHECLFGDPGDNRCLHLLQK